MAILSILLSSLITTSCNREKDLVTNYPLNRTTNTKTYYIAAEEVEWDFAATGIN